MEGFFIEVTNNLLDSKHRKSMGTAVWEFMWCLDKITSIDEDGKGWVLGGKPIKLAEIKQSLGIAETHISVNLKKLKEEGYILIRRTPYGLVIGVNKAKKRFNQKVKSNLTKRSNLNDEKVKSNIRQESRTRQLDNNYKKNLSERQKQMVLTLKDWNNRQSMPIHWRRFNATGIVLKHGVEKVERLMQKNSQSDNGFYLFLTSLNQEK